MSEGTAGTAFFDVQNNFKATSTDFESLERVVSSTLSSIRRQFSSFSGVDFNPLEKVHEKVNQQAGLIERRLRQLFKQYQTFAKQGTIPDQPFSLAANKKISESLTQLDKGLTSQAGKFGDVDLAELRRTLINGLAEGGTAAARELQSQLRAALRESGPAAQSAFAGSPNTLRAGVLTRPVLQDVPETRSAQEFVAATKNATKARQDATKASGDAAAADEQAAKASKEAAAAAGGRGGGTTPPPPPSPPTPPGGGAGGGGGGFEEVLGDAQNRAIAALRQRIQEGTARFINGSDAVFDPAGAARGRDIVSARTAEPVPPIIADRLRQQVEAEVKQLQAQITSGDLIKLGGRFATPRPGAPGSGAAFTSLSTAHEVDNEKDLAAAQNLYAEHLRKAAADTALEQVAENERLLAHELLRLAEDVAEKRKAGILGPDTGVRRSGQNIIDERSGSPVVFNRTSSGGVNQLVPELQPLRFASVLLADQEKIEAAETAAYTRALREDVAAAKEMEASQRAATRQAGRSGIGNNFISGLTSGGFSGDGTGGIDGLARAAGTTLKYSSLYQALGLLQQALHASVEGFLDANDSITEYEVATGHAGAVTAEFQTNLESIAQLGGFNVGEAMDVASKAVRAFGDELRANGQTGQEAFDRLSVGFARQASRLATLSKTTLTDASGNLTAIAAGFELPKNNAGFARVTDAIAGAKLAGGGDETQIFQGLANAAITFKSLGFSLNESATILSKINAETDESGTLIANRLSRLTGILNGGAATTFINQLNQQLPKDEQIDRSGPQRDQVLALSKAYAGLSEARKGALVSQLGGTAEQRELAILLQNLPQIVAEASKIQPGAGLKEFETRLGNVRAILTQIQGFIKTIIVNIATSGLADPIVELVIALQGALKVLSGISQGFKQLASLLSVSIGGANVSIFSLISNVVALGVALKTINAIRAAGGIRGALGAAEERIAPGRALARQQLTGTTSTATAPVAGVHGGAAAALERVNTVLQLPKGVAADEDVRRAGDDVKAAAKRLANAEDAQASLINRQTEERRAFAEANPADRKGLGALSDKQEQERRTAAQAGITAQLDLTTSQAQLARVLKVQAVQAEVAAEFDARRSSITGSFQRKIGSTIGDFQSATAKGDTKGVQAALDREALLREQFNNRLAALETERIATEQRATAIANASLKARILDGGTGGAVGAAAAARADGAGVLGASRAFGGAAIAGIGRGIGALFRILGPVGIGLTAIDFGLQVKGAITDIDRARQDLRDDITQSGTKPISVANLRDQASNFASARQGINEARSGITGRVAEFANDYAGRRDAKTANQLSAASSRAADALDHLDTKLRSGQSGNVGAASTIDITSADTVNASFDALTQQGYSAAQSMEILIERIKELRLVTTSTAELTAHEKGTISAGAGFESVKALRQLPDRIGFGFGLTPGLPITTRSASDDINAKELQARTDQVVTAQLNSGKDLGTAQGKKALEKALIKGYEGIVPDQKYGAELAGTIGDYVYKKAHDFAAQVASVAQLQTLIQRGLVNAEADAQATQHSSQLAALTSGKRDNSAVAAANTRVADLTSTKAAAQAKLQALRQAGTLPDDDFKRDLSAIEDAITAAKIQQVQALTQQAQQTLQDSTLVRRNEQGRAKTAAQIKAIGQRFFQADIKTALATNDIDTIRSVFDLASQVEVNAILKELDNVQATLADAAKTAQARAVAANAALRAITATAPAATRDTAGGAVEAFDTAAQAQASAAARRANRDANAAVAQASAAHKAAKLSFPQNVYDTGTDRNGAGGDTFAQIAAANAQAKAIRDRNSTEGLRAAVQVAQADYDAAKDQKAKAQALQQLYAAENALADGLRAISNARRFVNIFPASQVQSAAKGIADARLELAKTARGTIEYYQGLAALVQAQRQLAEANQAAYFVGQKLRIDLTNPVAEARIAVREAAAKLRLLQKEGAPRDLQNQARLDLRQAQNQSESAAFSQRLSDAQTNDELGRISHAAYLRYLNNEHNRLTAIRHRTRQQQDELNQIDQAIKSASQELQGQFNLGDIKLPTPYEVRRYIATQAKAATLTATAAAASGAAAGSSGAVSIVVNGADIAFVRRVLAEYLGPSATSTRAVSASRKG